MNTYAKRTGLSVYKNPGIKKRNPYQASPKRIYKNTEATGYSIRGAGTGAAGPAVDSILAFFRGTIVNPDASGIEWGTL